jgi:AbrB family looped-hinge helix DNA binding protein
MEQKEFSHLNTHSHNSYVLQLDERGRLVLPKAVRELLQLQSGEKLMASIKGGILKITPIRDQIAKARGILAKVNSKRCLSDELIAERRKEALRE